MKVRVFKKGKLGIDESELDKLLAEAGCVEVDEAGLPLGDETDNSEGEPDQELDGEDEAGPDANEDEDDDEEDDVTLIVVLTPECADDPELDGAVGTAIGSGGRAVGVWPKGAEDGAAPPILSKVGSGIVTWDPKKLSEVLSDTKTTWEKPDGTPRPKPITKRNKC